MFSMTESAILSNRKKIRDLEGQVYNARYKVTNLEEEITKLKSSSEDLDKVNSLKIKDMSNQIQKLEKQKSEKIDEAFKLRKSTENKEKEYKLFMGRLDVLEDLLKKTESLLISIDSIFNETITKNAGPTFICLNKEKMGEIGDAKVVHQQSLIDLRTYIESQGNIIQDYNNKIAVSERDVVELEEDLSFSLDEDMEM